MALVAIVWSQSSGTSDDAATPTPTMSESAAPSASAEPSATESTGTAVTAVEAPTKFVALKSADGLKLRWVAPTAVAGLTVPGSPFVVIGNVVAGTPGLRLV